jgi:hypothetical protein
MQFFLSDLVARNMLVSHARMDTWKIALWKFRIMEEFKAMDLRKNLLAEMDVQEQAGRMAAMAAKHNASSGNPMKLMLNL